MFVVAAVLKRTHIFAACEAAEVGPHEVNYGCPIRTEIRMQNKQCACGRLLFYGRQENILTCETEIHKIIS